jgi:hypothetical protein
MMKKTIIPFLSTLLFINPTSQLEVGTNCLAITCEVMEGKCCDRSDMELKVTLADNCSKIY